MLYFNTLSWEEVIHKNIYQTVWKMQSQNLYKAPKKHWDPRKNQEAWHLRRFLKNKQVCQMDEGEKVLQAKEKIWKRQQQISRELQVVSIVQK